ncbi:MAG: S9 family peptidase [Flavobacteriaceae bacterium]|nr:S9 family peptidase [Flavobacteriaceae bacterium]
MSRILSILLMAVFSLSSFAQNKKAFSYLDVFALEYANDPQFSPDGKTIIYRRMGFDMMKDRSRGAIWMMHIDGSNHQKLTTLEGNEWQARWSPTGDRIAFVRSTTEGSEIYIYWVNSGKSAKISQLATSPSGLTWNPSGTSLAFSMKVNSKPPVIAKMPARPKGAKWAAPARITDRLKHEADGAGYLKPGFHHIFVLDAQGGTARQLTNGNFNHRAGLSWHPNGQQIFFSTNRNEDWEYDFRNSEIYSVDVFNGKIQQHTNKPGPDYGVKISPDGKTLAYLGYTDKVQTHQNTIIYLQDVKSGHRRELTKDIDRSFGNLQWNAQSTGLYTSYDEYGNTKIAYISTSGKLQTIAHHMGGTTIGRPYPSGAFCIDKKGNIVYTKSTPYHPAELVYQQKGKTSQKTLSNLNADLLDFRQLGKVETIWYKSSVDGRKLQGWIVYPPFYDASKKYPMLVENHGGPILNYGDRFSAEMQLYATEGYIVFYPNPRGSTSYGEEFGNLLYHNYPGNDYDDVMDGVDALIAKGIAHEDQLYVTGGSAGGIMTAWMIGKNKRFEAAVVAKPVVNWISKTLVADNYYGYAHSRYPGQPWENFETYWKFSPISLVANIETPTMVLVGMNDLRTPPSEAKQLYHALKLRKVPTVLVEIPGASHGIAAKPSNLISKISHTVAWLKKYEKKE